nr:MAG TPA: replisome organizer protein [Bacteriophage sp.]
MSEDKKRFWWLKLKEGFFNSTEMRLLRKSAGGEVFTIIYLKMQLVSLRTDGIIFYNGYAETFEKEIAFVIDEDAENVANAIGALRRLKLIEDITDKSFFIPEAVANTGSECDSAARVRRLRERKALQSNDEQ